MTRVLGRPVARYGLAAGVAMCGAAVVSTAVFACTAVMGPLTLNPNSGHAGSTVETSASGLKIKPAKYALHFTISTSSTANCMAWTGVNTLKTIRTNSSGGWTNVAVMIPSNAALGTHGLCGMEVYPVKGQTGTDHGSFTVV